MVVDNHALETGFHIASQYGNTFMSAECDIREMIFSITPYGANTHAAEVNYSFIDDLASQMGFWKRPSIYFQLVPRNKVTIIPRTDTNN